jgi:hypothetical protein
VVLVAVSLDMNWVAACSELCSAAWLELLERTHWRISTRSIRRSSCNNNNRDISSRSRAMARDMEVEVREVIIITIIMAITAGVAATVARGTKEFKTLGEKMYLDYWAFHWQDFCFDTIFVTARFSLCSVIKTRQQRATDLG